MYGECRDCGDEKAVRIYKGGGLCKNCLNEVLFSDLVFNYSHKPQPSIFQYPKNNNLYMGFELEVEQVNEENGIKAEAFKNFLKKHYQEQFFYLKEDGSLDSGFEMVSHPFTLSFAKKYFKLSKILSWLRNNSFEALENCGMHIHINRAYFSEKDLIRMRIFFSLNQEYLYKLSGREDRDNSYCQYEDLDLDMFLNGEEEDYDRDRALNFSTHDHSTIELRLFQSTLDFKRFMSYLEFAEVISLYCKKTTIKDIISKEREEVSWGLFCKWLVKNNKYKKLIKTLEKEDILKV